VTKVMVGAPVRDRAWILPRFITHIKEQDLTDIDMETRFIANDCTDNTVDLLTGAGFTVEVCDGLPSKTAGSIRGEYSYGHLASLRNRLVERFLESESQYLLSVDTDVLVPAHGLRRLLDHRRDICAMLICNELGRWGHRAHNIMQRDAVMGYRHVFRWSRGCLLPVDVTGAVYLIDRRVLERGVRYEACPRGEDLPFCSAAQEAGFKLWCDTSLTPIHVMAPGVELVGGC
jgi:hypothetical protein